MSKTTIALFGGTFDPIHLGHTKVAEAAADHIGAEEVFFIPAKRSPLKSFLPVASDRQRLDMIRLAIEGKERFRVSDYELKRAEPSYTLHTVMWFQEKYGPDVTLHWLIGADTIDELDHWYRIEELIDRCNLSTMYRAGFPPPDFSRFESIWGPQRVEKLRRNIIPTPLVDISSTCIRKRLASGLDVSEMLHPAVAEYIQRHRLYRPAEGV